MGNNPEGYDRAVGVIEIQMQCQASDCGKQFRSAHQYDTKCPHCGSSDTKKIINNPQVNQ